MSEKAKIALIVVFGVYGCASVLALVTIFIDMAGVSDRFFGDFLIPFDMRFWVAPFAGIGAMASMRWVFESKSESTVDDHS